MELERVESQIKLLAPALSEQITEAAAESHNEAEFRTKVARYIEDFAERLDLTIPLREEYTLFNGRADAVYNRLVVEYKFNSLRPNNSYKANRDAIEQVKGYIASISRRERHKPERLAGVVLDSSYFIFVRYKEGVWRIDEPLKVAPSSTERFLRLLASLSTELALIPENLIRDFGENTIVSRKAVGTFYEALQNTRNPKVKTLFEQWSLQFGEVCDYSKASKLNVGKFARAFGIKAKEVNPFHLFFAIHTYYATFIKLLAVQIVHFYMMPKLGTDLKQAATLGGEELKTYMERVEEGGLFRDLGIINLLEADFFRWYLDIWDEAIYQVIREIISQLANYSLVTLDIDPEETRDLLKKLYQHLMPKQLRHNLGEYYTPDWLAERLLMMLCGERKGHRRYIADVKPDMRLLDPACGSGTFLVIAIKRIREYAKARMLPEAEVLEKILTNVVGFDLNPLAVISARTNYLLALGDLVQHRKGDINIPVYLCDSIMTPSEGEDLYGKGIMQLPRTAVGPFDVPKSLVEAKLIDKLANFLEEAVEVEFSREQFVERLAEGFPLDPAKDSRDMDVVYGLYDKLLRLKRQGINGIWARIVKNAFAPLFCGKFDYVVGNPPWVNWESLPEEYRQSTASLWAKHKLFPHKGFDAILGKSKDDISVLMAYVAMDRYLKNGGKLGFLITQSVFKTAGAGQGFRRFELGDGTPLRVLHVDDMVELQPFEGASNRTSLVILQKSRSTKYPMPSYLYWKKTAKGKSIALDSTLEEVSGMTARKEFVAEPVSEDDPTSSWITGKPKVLKAIRRVLGRSAYKGRKGVTASANGVFWVEVIAKRPDGLFVVSNITKGAKRKVEDVQATIEPDLLYPLLRGRDVQRWQAEPSAYILITHLPGMKLKAIPEEEMKDHYPKTYLYLKRFEKELRQTAVFKRYFRSEDPLYSMFNIGEYTFAPYKVVLREIATALTCAVIGKVADRPIIPDHKLILCSTTQEREAHFICALLGSSPSRFIIHSYAVETQVSTHIFENIRIPKFDPDIQLHLQLAELSQRAHELAARGEEKAEALKEVEEEIDELAAKLWELTDEELREIQESLKELG